MGFFKLVQALVGVIGLPVVVCSVILLLKQTREMTRQTELANSATRASVYQNITTLMVEIDCFFIDHPELKPYFYNNVRISENHPNYSRVMSVAELLVDFMDNVLTQAPIMPGYPWDTWRRYFRDIFASSPALQNYWAGHREWYPNELRNLLDSEKSEQCG